VGDDGQPTVASLDEIERVYRERFAEFVRVAAAITGGHANAPDVVQDAFAVLIRKRGSFLGRGTLEGWIWRGVVNTALNHRTSDRRRARRQSRELQIGSKDPNEPPALTALKEDLAELPERQRLVVFLRYYADLDYSTIGTTLDISPGTVASTLSSAHQRLRGALAEEATS
jgi:RNA polymerase sigma factor (sigma-70 family)